MGDELTAMDEELQVDWLDAKLREEAPYLDDAGFTARVAAKLPACQQSRSFRHAIVWASAVLAMVVTYFAGGGVYLGNTAAFLVAMPLATVCALAGVTALLVTVLGAAAAMKRRL